MTLDWSRLASWPFLLGLCLLLLNDHILKYQWPNVATGKLSDFAGLFVVGFLMAGRQLSWWRLTGILGLVPAFLWWKSASSSSAISAWNGWAPFPIGRTVDLSDGIALLVLPLAVWAASKAQPLATRRAAGWVILVCTWAGIVATSVRSVKASAEPLVLQYPVPISKAQLLADLQSRGEISPASAAGSSGTKVESFRVRAELSCGLLHTELDIGESSGSAVISPRKIEIAYHCVQTHKRDSILVKFREHFIGRYLTTAVP